MDLVANLADRLAGVGAVIAPLLIGAGAGIALFVAIHLAFRQLAKRTTTVVDDAVYRHAMGPLGLFLPVLGVQIALPIVRDDLPETALAFLRQTLAVLFALAVGWAAWAAVRVLVEVLRARFELGGEDNLRARKVVTQLQILQQIALYLVALLTLAGILMTFEPVRRLGAGIFASAGIAGVILGFAAQKSLANLLAGLQIAFTQPIRIDDVVVIQGEWGRIEEITLTYVVVRIWDLRRLVVPIVWFVENPFQNWTRVSAEVLGTVTLRVDYTVPVDAVREELQRLLAASSRWDGRVSNLQVTEADRHGLELRALMSAPDSGTAWDLRCEIREGLVAFLRERYPGSLPRVRAEVGRPEPAGGEPTAMMPP